MTQHIRPERGLRKKEKFHTSFIANGPVLIFGYSERARRDDFGKWVLKSYIPILRFYVFLRILRIFMYFQNGTQFTRDSHAPVFFHVATMST